MKNMIMMFGSLGATLETRTPEWMTSMHEFMLKLDGELKEAGEVVASHGVVDPSQARTVRFQNGGPGAAGVGAAAGAMRAAGRRGAKRERAPPPRGAFGGAGASRR